MSAADLDLNVCCDLKDIITKKLKITHGDND